MQDSLIFKGAKKYNNFDTNTSIIFNNQKVFLRIDEDITLQGVYSKHKSDSLIIYFGGNFENINLFINRLSTLQTIDSIGFNYRGYGKSEGEPSEANLFSDALKIYDHYKTQYKHISLIGRSLGTSVSTYLASQREVDNLILITPFDSIKNIAQSNYPIFPIPLLLKHPFESIKYIPSIKSPISVLMLKNDTVVPNKNTFALVQKINHLKINLSVDNTTHNDIIYTAEVINFIKQSLF